MLKDVRQLFAELADLDPDARQRIYLERSIPDWLRDEVESLISCDRGEESLTADVVAAVADFALSEQEGVGEEQSLPAQIGPFRVVRVLGSGGMGIVFLASRADGEISQQVAIKLLRVGPTATSVHKRFLQERQILAGLHHPGIAQLLDAGRTESGEPYLVMEYVGGRALDESCQNIGRGEIIGIFIRICEAISFAHSHLVIHRDLKPSNILVDNSGNPKLLDFGIAKILDDLSVTQTAERMLTPRFASPEQLRGEPQNVATDIYSLGAVLDSVFPASQDAGEESRDLRAIVQMAMRPEPKDRYSSMDAFAADLRALRDHRVVVARRGSTAYKLRRFVRRNWVAVSSIAVAVTALSIGLFAANHERLKAQRRFNEVRQLANELFALDDEISMLPGSTKARHQLVSTSLAYLERLRPDALQDRSLALEIGTGYMRVGRAQGVPAVANLGLTEDASRSLEKADGLLTFVLDSEPTNRRAMIASMHVARDRMILSDVAGRTDDVRSFAARAGSQAGAILDGISPDREETQAALGVMANVSQALNNIDNWEESALFAERCASFVRIHDPTLSVGIACETVLGQSLRYLGRLEEAIAAMDRAEAMLPATQLRGEVQRLGLKYAIYWRRGVILGETDAPSLGREAEAIKSLQAAFDVMEEMASRDPTESSSRIRLSTAGREIADIVVKNDATKALAVREHCLRRLGEIRESPAARAAEIWHLAGSAEALRKLGRVPEAEARLKLAFSQAGSLGSYPPKPNALRDEVAFAMRTRAEFLASTGRRGKAIEELEDLLSREMEANSHHVTKLPTAYKVAGLWLRLSQLYAAEGKKDQSETFRQNAIDLWRAWEKRLPRNPFVLRQLAAAKGSGTNGVIDSMER